MLRSLISTIAVGAAALVATAADAAVIPHDQVLVWPEPQPADATQFLAVKFKPLLKIFNGCQSYPGVDVNGNTSGGLKPTGAPSGSCSDTSKAQVYARSGWYKGQLGIMYAWYMPKDSPSTGLGHRHEWENAIVWLENGENPAAARIVAIAASAHGNYKKSYPVNSNYIHQGVSAKISYKSTWPINHEMGFTGEVGSKQPLIQWEQMNDAARLALETTDFGSATVPFKSNFENYLAEAYYK